MSNTHTFLWENDLRGQGDGSNTFPSYTIADNATLDALETATQSIKAALLDLTPSQALPNASQNTVIKFKTIEDQTFTFNSFMIIPSSPFFITLPPPPGETIQTA